MARKTIQDKHLLKAKSIKANRTYKAIGLMSGTSIDGIDVALVQIRLQPLAIQLLGFQTYTYAQALRTRLLAAASGQALTAADFAMLDRDTGKAFGQAVNKILRKAQCQAKEIAWIGSHGQTIFHGTDASLQIGHPSWIKALTGIPVIADFRPADIAAGGQGAPLTPFFNWHYFQQFPGPHIFLNIGGISNVTWLPSRRTPQQVQGFDTGPGNMLLDGAVAHFFPGQKPYDAQGRLAAQGQVHPKLLQQLRQDAFVQQKPPKSAGREDYGQKFLQQVLQASRKYRLSSYDVLATLTAFTAQSIADNIQRYLPRQPAKQLIVSGGGRKNRTLMQALQMALPDLTIKHAEDFGLNSDAAEAMAFAFFGGQTLLGQASNLPSVTGAKHSVILGACY